MDNGIKNARGLLILFSGDYETSAYTRKEFTSFEAERLQDERERHVVVLRCEDAPLRGLKADVVYQDLVGVADPEERKRRILAAAALRSAAERPQRRRGRTFVGVPPRIASFTGRAGELDQVDAILIQKRPAAVTQIGRAAVQGMGGVGKSALAVEYANRFRNFYDGVWWCPAETRASLMTSLAKLAVELEAGAADEADVEKAATAALSRLAEQGDIWLLIYDNVASPEEIAYLLPAAGARVLITSRFSDWSGWADEVSLDVLPLADAVRFLMDRSGRSDEAGARTLAEALGRLPLALDHAAAFCKRTGMSFAAYAAKASSLIDSAPRGAAYPRSVAATFDLAIDDAVKQCPEAEELIAFLAFCAPERIPMTLVEGAIDDESKRMAALAALTELSLIKQDPFDDRTPAVAVHRLVQAAARARSERKAATQSAVGRLLGRPATVYPGDAYSNPASWQNCATLTPHVLASTNTADDTEAEKSANLLNSVGSYLHGRGNYLEARPLFERALEISEEALGLEHLGTVAILNNFALLIQAQGDLSGARPLYERVGAIREKALGPDHPDTATALNNLASLLRSKRELTAAQSLFERALAIREKMLGLEHPATATSLDNLAYVIQDQGDHARARALCERALVIYEKSLGPEHHDTAICINHLAGLFWVQGDFAAARPLLERSRAIREKTLGPDHPLTATALANLARLLLDQGDLASARPLFERALAIREKALGQEHPATIATRDALAKLREES